jgi:ascorbate-specific PTS system EIIC-type component UlaA
MTLAISARDPNMLIVYPAFFVGATTQCYASYRRGAAWVMILTFYFSCVNIFGYGVAAGWW